VILKKCKILSRLVEFVKRTIAVTLNVLKDANSDGLKQLLIVPVMEGKFIGVLPGIISVIDE